MKTKLCYSLLFLVLSADGLCQDKTSEINKLNIKELSAAILIGEATGEGEIGMRAVWEVINNRAAQKNKSIYSIITQNKQFSCLNNTTPSSLINKSKNDKNWSLALKIVNSPLTNHVKGSNHYHTKQISPYWVEKSKFVIEIKNHRFYKL